MENTKARILATPLVKRLAAERGVDLSLVPQSVPGKVSRADLDGFLARAQAAAQPPRVRAYPLVRRLAREKGIDLRLVTPSGPDGRITRRDLDGFAPPAAPVAPVAAQTAAPAKRACAATPLARKLAEKRGRELAAVAPGCGGRIYAADVLAAADGADILPREKRRERMKSMRKVIAERMQKSYFTYPTVTLTTDVDMKALNAFRAAYNQKAAAEGVKLTVTDLILAATARALKDNEIINARIEGDEIVYLEDVNVSLAVGLPKGGILMPVIRRADTLSLKALSQRTKTLVAAAREMKLSPDDMAGGTFTVTNMGKGEIDAFNPIINYPESAILGVGRIKEKPVAIDGMIAIRPMAVLSLTHDHRLIDGVPASEFLKSLVHYLENPALIEEK